MDELLELLSDYKRRLEALEKKIDIKKITLPSDGKLVVPVVTADPGSPTNGQVWYNSTSHALKVYVNGVVRTVTVT